MSPSLTACPARSHGVRALPPRHRRDSTDPPTPSTRTTHTPSTRLAGRRRRAVVELRVARHPFGILAEPRLKRALARRLLLPRLGLARAPRRVPALAPDELLEVDRGAADCLWFGLWRRPVCFTCLHAVDASLAVHAWHSRRPHAIERCVSPCPASRHLYAIDAMASSTPSTQRAPHAIAATPHAIDATHLSQRDAGHARWWRRLRGQTLRHFDGRPGPGLLHVRGDALDLRVASMSFGPLAGERSPAVRRGASTASSQGYGPASRHRRDARKRTPLRGRAARTCIV